MGRFSDVLQVCAQGRERAHSHGLVRTQTKYGAVNEVPALIALGRWDDALDLTQDLLAQTLPDFAELGLSLARAELLVRRGDPAAADAVAGLDRMTDWYPGEPQWSLPVAMVRAEHALALSDPPTALATLLETVATIEGPLFPYEALPPLHTLARAITSVEQTTGQVQQQARTILARARQSVIPSGLRQVWDAVLDAELTPGDEDTVDRWDAAYRALTDPAVEGSGTSTRLHRLPARGRPAGRGAPGRRRTGTRRRARAGTRRCGQPRSTPTSPRSRAEAGSASRVSTTPPACPAGAGVWLTPREHDVLAPRHRGPLQRPDRRRAVHQPQDRQRPRLQHPRQTRRHLPRRSHHHRPPRPTPRPPAHPRPAHLSRPCPDDWVRLCGRSRRRVVVRPQAANDRAASGTLRGERGASCRLREWRWG